MVNINKYLWKNRILLIETDSYKNNFNFEIGINKDDFPTFGKPMMPHLNPMIIY